MRLPTHFATSGQIIGIVYTNYVFAVYALTCGKHVVNAWYLFKMHV